MRGVILLVLLALCSTIHGSTVNDLTGYCPSGWSRDESVSLMATATLPSLLHSNGSQICAEHDVEIAYVTTKSDEGPFYHVRGVCCKDFHDPPNLFVICDATVFATNLKSAPYHCAHLRRCPQRPDDMPTTESVSPLQHYCDAKDHSPQFAEIRGYLTAVVTQLAVSIIVSELLFRGARLDMARQFTGVVFVCLLWQGVAYACIISKRL